LPRAKKALIDILERSEARGHSVITRSGLRFVLQASIVRAPCRESDSGLGMTRVCIAGIANITDNRPRQCSPYVLHDLDPIIFRVYDNIGPRWYGLAYVLAFICGYALLGLLANVVMQISPASRVGDFVTGCALFGVIIGGRLGYVFFYKPEMLREPLVDFARMGSGMSSHGGMIGLLFFTLYYARRHKLSWPISPTTLA